MRNINIFRTSVRDHQIPREIMVQAIMLSPGQDWTDPKTQAYQHIKMWALEQDKHRKGTVKSEPVEDWLRKEEIPIVTFWNDRQLPEEIVEQAKKLSPGKNWLTDSRTKGYKFIDAWALEQDKRDEAGK